jgi:hypothetical protein
VLTELTIEPEGNAMKMRLTSPREDGSLLH